MPAIDEQENEGLAKSVMKSKGILFLVSTCVLIGFAWKISEDRIPQTELARAYFYPALLDQSNDITSLTISQKKKSTSLSKQPPEWEVTNKDGFTANSRQVRQLILQIADLRIVEPKTSLVSHHKKLGLQEIKTKGGSGTLITLSSKDGNLVSLIVGKKPTGTFSSQHYVRRSGEDETWLVQGKLDAPADPIKWTDSSIMSIDTKNIEEVTITRPKETAITITKKNAKEEFFSLNELPDGFRTKSEATLSSIGAILLNLRFNDVRSAKQVSNLKASQETTVRTFDQITIRMVDYEIGEKLFTKFIFGFPDGLPKEINDKFVTLAEKTSHWIYQIPGYKRRMIARQFSDLIEKISE